MFNVIFKVIVVLIFVVIAYCLISGLFYLFRAKSNSTQMAKALTWRIALSFGLFALLMVAYLLGWIHPHVLWVTPSSQ